MSVIKFKNNCYLSTLETYKCMPEGVFNRLQFHYGNVTYAKFSKAYDKSCDKEDWLIRKLCAFPRAMWKIATIICGVVKLLFVAVFQPAHFKYHCYSKVQDVKEFGGRLISFIHDRYGLYLIQSSQYQKRVII